MAEGALSRRCAAEAVGTGILIVAVIGSGIMAERLTQIVALQLLCNAVATGCALFATILIFAPVSGASFNPVVGIVGVLCRSATVGEAVAYAVAQFLGACCGAVVANLMFGLQAVDLSGKIRGGSGVLFSEIVATAGLLLVIHGTIRANRVDMVPLTVATWITGAYFFTSSTSFANPAVTVARSLSDSFAGIAPRSVPPFIAMQLIGSLVAFVLIRFLFAPPRRATN